MTHLLCYASKRFPEQYGVVKIKIRALRIANTKGVKLAPHSRRLDVDLNRAIDAVAIFALF